MEHKSASSSSNEQTEPKVKKAVQANEVKDTFIAQVFDKNGHLILGMSFSYFLGWLGFHFSWVVLLFYIVYQFEKEREERVWHRKLEEYEKKKKEMERKTKLVQTKERIEWFNTLFHKLWPKMGPFMVETTQKTTKNIIEKTLDQLKPPVVESVVLSEIDFGTTPPEISELMAHSDLPNNCYKLDLDLSYEGELRIVVTVGMGKGLVNIKVPIEVNEIRISTRVHLRLDLVNKLPYVHTASVTFSEPLVHVSVKPLKAFDLLGMSVLQNWFQTTLARILETTPVVVRLIKDGQSLDNPVNETDQKIQIVKGNTGSANCFSLVVRLIEARRLKAADIGGASDPFCVLKCGSSEVKSEVIKQNVNPEWNQSFQFELSKDLPAILNCEVYDWDRIGNDFLGRADVDFTQFPEDVQQDLWVNLKDKEGRRSQGELHLQITYINNK